VAEKIDPVLERERLAKRYAAMSDLELERVGRDPDELTEWAQHALKQEMDKRGIAWTTEASTVKANAVFKAESIVPLRTYPDLKVALNDWSALQAVRIETFLYDEAMPSPKEGQEATLIGGIKLMVRARDSEKAQQFLEQRKALQEIETEEQVESGVAGKPMVLRSYRDMPSAFVDKSVLEAAGIRCLLQDENVVRMDWLWSNAVGGIKLVVSEVDLDEAAKILDATEIDSTNKSDD
jgi:hypothetical protein